MKKTVFIFGLLAVAVAITVMVATVPLLDSEGYRKADLLGYSGMVLSALLVFFGIHYYRDRATEGRSRAVERDSTGVTARRTGLLAFRCRER